MEEEIAEALFINWKKRLYYGFFAPFHRLMRWWYGKALFPKAISKPKKILLCNLSALGDVFLSTYAIPVLKEAYPDAEIAVLVSFSSSVALKGCPGIDRIHLLSPWLCPGDSFLKKLGKYLSFHFVEKRRSLRELTAHRYDWAINFYPFFSEVIPLFLRAKIPVRVGFDALGYRALFSHTISWERGKYLTHLYWRLMQAMGIEERHKPHFISPWIQIPQKPLPHLKKKYWLFHMVSANPSKDLSTPFWSELLKNFNERGMQVYFTGRGEEQRERIASFVSEPDDNLCDRLSWEELIQAAAHAKGIVTVDTVIVHLAAAIKTPYIVLYQKTPDPDLWRPESENGLAFIKKENGPAFHIRRRDDRLIWVDNFEAQEVFAKAAKLLR